MLLPVGSAFALAAEEEQGSSDAVVFTLTKVSETTNEVKILFSVTDGRVLCFDATVKTAEGLVCSAIDYTSAYMSYIIGNDNGAYAKNQESSMLSFANPDELNGPLDIATFTFTKSEAAGVTKADFSVEISSCYQKGESGDVPVTVETIVSIPETHEHTAAGEWVTLKDSTCTAAGEEVRYCSECGEVAESREIRKKAHTGVEDKKDATCEENGYIIERCSVCNQKLSETVLPATNHENTVTQHKDATCEETGYDRIFCNDCQQVISETILPATNHENTVDQHKDATCGETGYDRIFCNDCQQVISETILPTTEHQNERTETLEPTCEKAGYIRVICDDCHTIVKETVLPISEHKYVSNIKKETCTTNGYIEIICSKCKQVKSKVDLSAPGHSWSEWKVVKEPTYRSVGTERKTCRSCGIYEERELPMIEVPVQQIIIVPEKDFTIYAKKADRLQATVLPEEAAYSAEIVWESSAPNIVSVDKDGNIKALRKGTATITAKTADGTVSASRKVTVDYSWLQWIIIILLFGWIWYL